MKDVLEDLGNSGNLEEGYFNGTGANSFRSILLTEYPYKSTQIDRMFEQFLAIEASILCHLENFLPTRVMSIGLF